MSTATVYAKNTSTQVVSMTDTIELFPSGGDDTAQINSALSTFGSRGGKLLFHVGVYNVPNGITESVPGIVVEGVGARCIGPGTGGAVGVALVATASGTWVWKHVPPSTTNEYRGGRFQNITFQGNGVTAGGLLLQTSYNVVRDCAAINSTTGNGFMTAAPATGSGADASWNMFEFCLAQDNLTGFQIGNTNGAASAQLYGCVANKTTAGGIAHTGTGISIFDNNSCVTGGKVEGNDTGLLINCPTAGVTVIGLRYENNQTWDADVNRASGTSGSLNIVIGNVPKLRFGQFEVGDVFIGGESPNTVTDLGSKDVMLGNTRVKSAYIGATVPSGGLPGEIKVASGKIWVNDGGVWKSAPIS